MKISEIYEKYKIMPNLQEHMLRVSGIASIICDNFEKTIDKRSIISACLLHDMGNIIKFPLGSIPELIGPKGLKYWKNIQKEYTKKYGVDENRATYCITNELNITNKIDILIKQFGFSEAKNTFKISDYEFKIGPYSDHRTNPFGVRRLEERFIDLKTRYASKLQINNRDVEFENLCIYWNEIEKQIFARCKIKPEDITEEIVEPFFEELRNFIIETNI